MKISVDRLPNTNVESETEWEKEFEYNATKWSQDVKDVFALFQKFIVAEDGVIKIYLDFDKDSYLTYNSTSSKAEIWVGGVKRDEWG